jgi:hypothetical protein
MNTTQIEVSNVRKDDDGLTATISLYDVAGYAHLEIEAESYEAKEWAAITVKVADYLNDPLCEARADEMPSILGDEEFKALVSGAVTRLWVVA